MLHAQRGGAPTRAVRTNRDDGVIEPDARLVFAVLAAGTIIGALLTTPARSVPGVDAFVSHPKPLTPGR